MEKVFLRELLLENFKCYKKATIKFKDVSIIVGENNAGKSCLIEALRLIAMAASGAKKRTFTNAPPFFPLPHIKGFRIDTTKLKIDLKTIIYFYNQAEYAKITAFFVNKSKIEIYINTNMAFAVIYDAKGNAISSKQKAENLDLHDIGILPQIGPIREQEKFLSDVTVKNDKDTYLTSFHFRNEIYLWKNDYFSTFKEMAEKTWNGLFISPIESKPVENENVDLLVRDNDFTAEIGKMGNGIQMWLQIVWFIARSKNCRVIILDEPDVYMHPDMQRKILEIVKASFSQVIIATHSLEIISRVEPTNILEINKRDKTMHYASDYASVQQIIDMLGGVSNLALLNLGRQRRCLFVEGKDIKYLNKFNEILYGKQLAIPNVPFGGFNNIDQVYGAAQLFYTETKDQIKCYALADKDYRDDLVISNYNKEAEKHHLNLHIWKRKEIENYLINPSILYRFIPVKHHVNYDDFCNTLENLLNEQKDNVFDSYSTQYRIDSRLLAQGEQWDIATCNKKARDYMKKNWNTLDDKIAMIGGKNFISIISNYFQETYNISLSASAILAKFERNDVPKEIADYLSELNI